MIEVLQQLPSNPSETIQSSLGSFVDLTHCLYRPESNEPASSYIIKSRAKDTRTIVNYNNLSEMSFDEFKVAADRISDDAVWYHYEVSLL